MIEKKYDELRINRLLNLAGYSKLKSVDNIRYIVTNYLVLKKCENLKGSEYYDMSVESISKYNNYAFNCLLAMLDVMINKCMSEIDSLDVISAFVDTLKRLFPIDNTNDIISQEVSK